MTDKTLIRDELLRQMGEMDYGELTPYLGRLVKISPRLDLIDAAVAVCADEATRVERWAKEGLLGRVTEDDLRAWHARRPRFRAVVTAPWVLVQERVD